MRIQTIHRNTMGDVFNECSAHGFRITTENGDVYDINTEGEMVTIQTSGHTISLEFIPELLRMFDAKKPAAVEGFDEWYDSVDARFWDNWDACNAAFHAGKRAALAAQQQEQAAWQDEWRAAVAAKLSGYGLSEEAAAVFAKSELGEYRAGLCDCAENDPADMVDLMMGVALDAIEKWKVESAGRPFGYKRTAPPSAPVGVGYAKRLATSLWQQHYREDAPQWEPCEDLMGLLSQIDNMVSGLTRAAQQPAADAEPKTLPVPTRVYLIGETAVIAGTPQRGWDEEGPDAHNCDDMGCSTFGRHVLARVPFTDERALPTQQGGGEINMDVTVRDGAWVGTYAEWCRRKQPAAVAVDKPIPETVLDRACDAYKQIADDCMGLVRRKAMRAALTVALGDARRLVERLAAHVRPTCSELWYEAQAFLAAEGVQAEPRPVLSEPDRIGLYQGPDDCPQLMVNDRPVAIFPAGSWAKVCDALDSITGSVQPDPKAEARGVVDGWKLVVRYGEYDKEPGVWAEKDGSFVWVAALATQHQEPKS